MTGRIRLQMLVTPWQPLAATAGTTLVLLASFGSNDSGVMTSRLRLAVVAVAATTAFLFDDPAAATVAPSPTPLLVRRGHRFVCLTTVVVAWWAAATVLLGARFDVNVSGKLTLELAATAAVAVGVALTIARLSGSDSPGMVGAIVAPTWFVLGYLPRPEWLAVPPAPGAGLSLLFGLTLAAVSVAIVASRDPCTRPIAPLLRRRHS